ncbi:MAG TPA: tetratricopeptide repeat protein [Vicinamibacterales bacterium]|nr:tetratricopeptide repeat protein [Vicinamibacterales bacterium]
MRKSTRGLIAVSMVAALSLSVTACGKFNELKARKNFKDANALYQQGEYRRAATEYETALTQDPGLVEAYFYLGNSYDNLYKVTRRGDPENDKLLDSAIKNYRIAAEKETNPKMKRLALEYLVAAYGPDKMNDPEQAEPIVRQMIEMDPSESANYFGLAKIYEDAGRYDEAAEALEKARQARPNDPAVYMQIAGFYNRQGDFERTIEALQQRAKIEPNNPEAYYTISTYYWDNAFRNFRLSEAEKKENIERGLEAATKAIDLNPNYMEALTYKNLLLRLKGNLEQDPARRAALYKEADTLRNRAIELQKKKTAGVGD